MKDEPFGRQPQPVVLIGTGDIVDVDHYLSKIKSYIENSSYDNCIRNADRRTMTIYPRAVND